MGLPSKGRKPVSGKAQRPLAPFEYRDEKGRIRASKKGVGIFRQIELRDAMVRRRNASETKKIHLMQTPKLMTELRNETGYLSGVHSRIQREMFVDLHSDVTKSVNRTARILQELKKRGAKTEGIFDLGKMDADFVRILRENHYLDQQMNMVELHQRLLEKHGHKLRKKLPSQNPTNK